MTFRTAVLALVTAVCAAPVVAGSATVFDDAQWSGRGVFRDAVDGPVQKGRCRIDSVTGAGTQLMEMSGRCAGVAASTKVLLKLEKREGNRVAAVFRLWAWDRDLQFVGTQKDGVIALTGRTPVELNEAPFGSALTIKWADASGFSMVFSVTPQTGPHVELLSMQFKHR
ncbi:MAG: hypothetical protein AB8B51_19935 [Sedimentitalea sp.]